MSTVSDQVILNWTGSQSVGPDAGYVVPWNAETLDASDYWSSGAPTRITVPTGKNGYHYITFVITATAGTGYRCFAYLQVYNSSNVAQKHYRGPMGRDDALMSVSAFTKLSDGDYITCAIYFASNARTINFAQLEVVRLPSG